MKPLFRPILICLMAAGAQVLTAQSPPAIAETAPAGSATVVPAPLETLEAAYAADRAAALRGVLARYADELQALERSLVTAGDTSGAARVRLERDRVLPALGLPTVAAVDADEFAAFEETPEIPVPPAPMALPADLDAILKSLLPQTPATPTTTSGSGPAAEETPAAVSGRGVRRVLRMMNAQLSGTYDPTEGYVYWTPGSSASWTVKGLPPGTYQLQLRYACDNTDGGKLEVQFGGTTLEAEIAPTGGWKRRRELVIGPFQITDARADLILKPLTLKPGASYLMDLNALLVQPAGAAAGSGKP